QGGCRRESSSRGACSGTLQEIAAWNFFVCHKLLPKRQAVLRFTVAAWQGLSPERHGNFARENRGLWPSCLIPPLLLIALAQERPGERPAEGLSVSRG